MSVDSDHCSDNNGMVVTIMEGKGESGSSKYLSNNGTGGDQAPPPRTLQAEVQIIASSGLTRDHSKIIEMLERQGGPSSSTWAEDPQLAALIVKVVFWDEKEDVVTEVGPRDMIRWHIYKLDQDGAQTEHMDEEEETESSSVHAARLAHSLQ